MVNVGLRGVPAPDRIGAAAPCLIVETPQALEGARSSGASVLLLRFSPSAAPPETLAAIRAARTGPLAPQIFLEVGPLGAGSIEAELDAAAPLAPAGVFLRGCGSRAELQQLSVKLAVREAEARLPEGALRIVAWAAQTPDAIFALGNYAGASQRLSALVFDAPALAAALGVPAGSPTIGAARAQLALGAAAAGVPALELAFGGDVTRVCGLAKDAGFAGVIAREAGEVAAIAAAFRTAG